MDIDLTEEYVLGVHPALSERVVAARRAKAVLKAEKLREAN
jgi:hypothetical protein